MSKKASKKPYQYVEPPDAPKVDKGSIKDWHTPKATSPANITLWLHFRICKAFTAWALCQFCKLWVKRTDGSPVNLQNHLRLSHDLDVREDAKQPREDQSKKLISFFKDAERKGVMTTAKSNVLLIKAIVSATLPFNLFDNDEFREWISYIASSYMLPSRWAATQLFDGFYNSMVESMKLVLQQAEAVSITTDSADARYTGAPFIVVTAHFLRAWKLIDVVIAMKHVPFADNSKSGVYISQLLSECIGDWDIDVIRSITTDNGSNYLVAAKLLTRRMIQGLSVLEALRCCCHSIQLVVRDALGLRKKYTGQFPILRSLHLLIQKVARCVNFIRNGPERRHHLEFEQAKHKVALMDALRDRVVREAVMFDLLGLAAELFENIEDEQQAQGILSDTNISYCPLSRDSFDPVEDDEYDSTEPEAKLDDDDGARDEEIEDIDDISEFDHHAMVSRATKLILRNATRWSSTFVMIHRFLVWLKPITRTLRLFNCTDSFTDHEIKVLVELVRVLEPFKQATILLQSSKSYPALSYLLPTVFGLRCELEDSQCETEEMKQVVFVMKDSINIRFKLDDVLGFNRSALFATMLDVRFIQLSFLTPNQAEQAWKSLRTVYNVAALVDANSQQSAAQADGRPHKKQKVNPAERFMCQTQPVLTDLRSVDSHVSSEFSHYQSLKSIDVDPLKWWAAHENEYPILSQIAKQVLCIPPSSASSERGFSALSNVNSAKRTRLDHDRLGKLAMCKHNITSLSDMGIDSVGLAANMILSQSNKHDQANFPSVNLPNTLNEQAIEVSDESEEEFEDE